jgi:hypothetical protein
MSARVSVKRKATKTQQWFVRILCAMALLFVGFAHQIPVIHAASGVVDVSEYVLPDGSLPVFCITDNGDDGADHGKMRMVHGCEACQMAASIVLPIPSDAPGYRVSISPVVAFQGAASEFHRPLFPPNTGPTGPPQSPISA